MSKSRDNKHRRQKAAYKLAEWREKHRATTDTAVPVEIVGVKGKLPTSHAK